ncbi:MAG: hypothetical protein GW849_02310 [Flavobacteriia bacterium]|nr:hypothetical protein [Flavobacteriia bacterium]NCT18021.1 hypothetical protein [Flavobacteriia bacterium]
MKHPLLFLILIVFFSACNTRNQKETELLQKENDLLKKELEFEKMKNEMETKKEPSNELQIKENVPIQSTNPSKDEIISTDIKALFKLLNNGFGSSTFDSQGNFSIDTGAASTGRVQGNLKQVNLSIEYLPIRPGCADICPEMAIIRFKCKFGNCLNDPNMQNFKSDESAISFDGLETGKKVYELMKRIQKNL